MNALVLIARILTACIWLGCVYICYLGLLAHDLSGVLLLAWFTYLIWPMKHPCDYSSYGAWWADRANWTKGSTS